MQKRILVVAAMLAMVAIGSFHAQATPMPRMKGPMDGMCPPPGPGPEPPGRAPEHITELLVVALDLNDAQQARMRKMLDEDRARHEKLVRELRDEEQTLHRMLGADDFNEKALRAMGMKVAEKRLDLMLAGPRLKTRMLAMLSAEQQAKGEKLLKLMAPPPPHREGPPEEQKPDAAGPL